MTDQSWIITTAVGTGERGFAGDGGPAERAVLNGPFDIGFDPAGNLYFSDTFNHRIRRVDARTGIITTIGGNGAGGYSGDGGPAHLAGVFGARAVKVAAEGTVFILERQGSSLRGVDPRTGVITTVAGTGARGYRGDDGPMLAAVFDAPKEFAIDPGGDLLIVDTENHAIRRINMKSGTVDTIAGGHKGSEGDGGPARQAGLGRPHGIAVGPDGALYIGDTENHRIRKLTRAC